MQPYFTQGVSFPRCSAEKIDRINADILSLDFLNNFRANNREMTLVTNISGPSFNELLEKKDFDFFYPGPYKRDKVLNIDKTTEKIRSQYKAHDDKKNKRKIQLLDSPPATCGPSEKHKLFKQRKNDQKKVEKDAKMREILKEVEKKPRQDFKKVRENIDSVMQGADKMLNCGEMIGKELKKACQELKENE